jgi:hypothetical protein
MNAILRWKRHNECLFGSEVLSLSFMQCGIGPRGMGMARSGEERRRKQRTGVKEVEEREGGSWKGNRIARRREEKG